MSEVQAKSFLFVVEDIVAGEFSPVFEQSSIDAAKRVFLLKTLKQLPEGFDVRDFALHCVGSRIGVDINQFDGAGLVMKGDQQ